MKKIAVQIQRGIAILKSCLAAIRKKPKWALKRLLLAMGIGFGLLAGALFFSIRGHLTLKSLPGTPIFEDRYGRYLAEAGYEANQKGFWEVSYPLPERVASSILAIEDKRFHSHHGIDWRSLVRAAQRTLFGHGREGGSTIAMQIARLQHPGRRTLWKKLCELITARWLVARYGRQEILRHYLRIVPQGNQIFGMAYAARRYFQKPLADLSWAESALLAALAKSPGKMNPFTFSGFSRAQQRGRLILNLLYQQGHLSSDDLSQQLSILEDLPPPQPEARPFHSYHAILRLYEEARRISFPHYTRPIRTSLDIDLQRFLNDTASRAMVHYRRGGAGNMAIIVTETDSGRIRGYLGAEDYFNAEYAGAINYACTPRSAGSTLKPFLFGLALTQKTYTPAAVIPDLPFSVTHSSGDYTVTNFDDSYLGPLLFRRALANSRNIPAIHVLQAIGLEKAYALFCLLHLADPATKPSHYGLNMAIGGLYVTLERLVEAYGMLANNGRRCTLQWFEADGKPPSQPRERILPEEIARLVTLFLSDPLARLPSFSRMGNLEFHFPVAIKTGTSQGFRDGWAVAFSSRYIVGVWIGHPQNERMKGITGLEAAGVVKRILKHLHPEENRGVREIPFPLPIGYEAIRLCPVSGKLASDICPEAALEYFPSQDKPSDLCDVHRRFAVDRRTGKLATSDTPRSAVRLKVCLLLPPEYAVWASHQGMAVPPAIVTDIRAASVAISQPATGSRFLLDPETPAQYQTLPLKAVVVPRVPRIDWYVDGRFFTSTPYPYETRWTIARGNHVIQARFPRAFVASSSVRITVK